MDVRDDPATRARYARDRSPFHVEPAAVAFPRDASEVAACLGYGLPVTVRAGGSSVAGQCLGAGLIVDVSGLQGIELAGDAGVWVGAGQGLASLNAELALSGRLIGPDVTSSQWAKIGGLVGTNACGSRSLRYGRFADVLLAAEVVRADGSIEVLSRGDECWPDLAATLDGLPSLVDASWPRQPRGFGGYALDAFGARRDPLSLVPGSEGTLCVVTRALLETVPMPHGTVSSRAEFPTLRAALDSAPAIARTGASAVEVLDSHLTGGLPALLVEHIVEHSDSLPTLPAPFVRLTGPEPRMAWERRRNALARLEAAGTTAVALFEDPAVAPERAGEFADALLELLRGFGLDAVVYGHAAAGCLHVRPLVDSLTSDVAGRLLEALEAVSGLVASFGGAITGEHGWGLARSHLAESALGAELYGRMVAVKRAWDPDGVLNPGRIVDAKPPDPEWLVA